MEMMDFKVILTIRLTTAHLTSLDGGLCPVHAAVNVPVKAINTAAASRIGGGYNSGVLFADQNDADFV